MVPPLLTIIDYRPRSPPEQQPDPPHLWVCGWRKDAVPNLTSWGGIGQWQGGVRPVGPVAP